MALIGLSFSSACPTRIHRARCCTAHQNRACFATESVLNHSHMRSQPGYIKFALANRRILAFGFLMALGSSFGQTFFIGIFSPSIEAEFGLSHSEWGTIYMAGTLLSAATAPIPGVGSIIRRCAPARSSVLSWRSLASPPPSRRRPGFDPGGLLSSTSRTGFGKPYVGHGNGEVLSTQPWKGRRTCHARPPDGPRAPARGRGRVHRRYRLARTMSFALSSHWCFSCQS